MPRSTPPSPPTPEQVLARFDDRLGSLALAATLLGGLLSIVLSPTSVPETAHTMVRLVSGAAAIVSAIGWLGAHKGAWRVSHAAVAVLVLGQLAFAGVVDRLIAIGDATVPLNVGGFVTISGAIVLIMPNRPRAIVGVAFVAGTSIALALHALAPAGTLVAYGLNFMLVVGGGRLLLYRGARHMAQLEIDARAAEAAAMNAARERELEVARDIQDSFAPRHQRAELAWGEVVVARHAHEKVGGDWITLQPLGPDRARVLIVDVVGHGLRAGMVLHALQSLWAHVAHEPALDLGAWLAGANQTLIRMGRGHPHCLTLAAAEVGPEGLRYWSAGHLPLFEIWDEDGAPRLAKHFGQGDMLGLDDAPAASWQPKAVPPRAGARYLLATDGLVPNLSRFKAKAAAELVTKIRAEGADALARIASDDDVTAAVISYA